jgi:hypothetical protein
MPFACLLEKLRLRRAEAVSKCLLLTFGFAIVSASSSGFRGHWNNAKANSQRKDSAMLLFHLSRKGLFIYRLATTCFVSVGFLLSVAASAEANARDRWELATQTTHKAMSPEEVTRQFYHWYLSAGLPNPKRSNMASFRKYVTQSCMKRATARDVESVLFIDAQDTDSTWANNYTVSAATMDGQTAKVEVDLNGSELKQHLRITLRREGGVWKIDDVKGSDRR